MLNRYIFGPPNVAAGLVPPLKLVGASLFWLFQHVCLDSRNVPNVGSST